MESLTQRSEAVGVNLPIHLEHRPFKSCARKVIPVHDRLTAFISVGICTLLLWVLATQGARMQQLTQQVNWLTTEVSDVALANDGLMVQITALEEPSRVLRFAKQSHMHEAIPIVIQPDNPTPVKVEFR